MFHGRKLIIATKHKKEIVIAPIVEKELGVSCFVSNNFDTDILGTFTGEVERELDPIATAKQKCLIGMQLSNCDLGIACEGSFGPHPALFFNRANDEFLIFIDKKNNVEIIAREFSTETNYNGKEILTENELLEFAEEVKFPSHGLILRKAKDENTDIIKGITDINHLKKSFEKLSSQFKSVYVETDMRALYNPTRLKTIEAATKKLVDKILSTCPECSMPGFGITDAKNGLECSLCGSTTDSLLSYISVCQHCSYTKENPTYCNYCNP